MPSYPDPNLSYLLEQAPPTLEQRWTFFLSGNPNAFQQLTVGAAVVSLQAPNLAQSADLVVIGADIRARFDGAAPTATTGLYLANGSHWLLTGFPTLVAAQFIRAGATSATVAVQFWD